MEEAKPANNTSNQATDQPPSAVQAPNPQPPPATLPPKSRKRSHDCSDIQNSKYFKMRVLVKDLRPHFVEVLRAPDFQNCKAAEKIREKMKLMIELCQQISSSNSKHDAAAKSYPLPNGNAPATTQPDQHKNVRPMDPPKTDRFVPKPSETWSFQAGAAIAEKQHTEGGQNPGSYIVGGSAFGWNFITFKSTNPVYYGVTKESFRQAQANSGRQ